MALQNPAFTRSPAFAADGQNSAAATATAAAGASATVTSQQLDTIYNQAASEASASGDVMTIGDTIAKSFGTFVLLVAGAGIGWATAQTLPFLWIGAAIVGFALALVNTFKKSPSAVLILLYSAVQGVFLGGISAFYEQQYPGIVLQAILGTFAVVGVTLALFASGKVRASKRATKVFMVAMVGYLVFSLINVILVLTGINSDPYGLLGAKIFGIPLGVVIGLFVVLLAAYSLVLDFDFIQRGVNNRAPRKYGWTGAFGIMVTVIWLYLEILRILALSRR